MDIIYLDETDCDAQKYSAVAALAFDDTRIPHYRKFLIQGLRKIFGRETNNAVGFPILHASQLPEELSAEQKIELFALFSNAISMHCKAILFEGYSWSNSAVVAWSKLPGMSLQKAARQAAVGSLQFELARKLDGPVQFVWENGAQSGKQLIKLYGLTEQIEQQLQMEHIGNQGAGYDINNVVGCFYCDKRDHIMYAVDFCLRQFTILHEPCPTEFKLRCADSQKLYRDKIFGNRIVN